MAHGNGGSDFGGSDRDGGNRDGSSTVRQTKKERDQNSAPKLTRREINEGITLEQPGRASQAQRMQAVQQAQAAAALQAYEAELAAIQQATTDLETANAQFETDIAKFGQPAPATVTPPGIPIGGIVGDVLNGGIVGGAFDTGNAQGGLQKDPLILSGDPAPLSPIPDVTFLPGPPFGPGGIAGPVGQPPPGLLNTPGFDPGPDLDVPTPGQGPPATVTPPGITNNPGLGGSNEDELPHRFAFGGRPGRIPQLGGGVGTTIAGGGDSSPLQGEFRARKRSRGRF